MLLRRRRQQYFLSLCFITSDLSLDKHVSAVSGKWFFQLRYRLRQIRRSIDDESVATFVHAFLTTRVDYCNYLLADALKRDNRQAL